MTNREFLNSVINNNIDTAVIDFAENQLAKLDERNKKRSSCLNARQKENESIKAEIIDFIKENGQSVVASEIGEQFGFSTQKASALLRQLAESGTLAVDTVKIPKKGKVKAYSLADNEVTADTENEFVEVER